MFKLLFYFLIPLMVFANPLENIQTFQADFTQSIINNSGKEIRYSGQLYAKKPSSIFWHYSDPIEKKVYLIRSSVTIIENDLEQAILSTMDKEMNILNLLKNAQKIAPNLYITTLNHIDYSIFLRDNQLSKISYKDEIDNKVTVYFENIQQNKPLNETLFQFQIPEHFDIIKK